MLQINQVKISPFYNIAYARVNYNVENNLFNFLKAKNIDLNPLSIIKNEKRRIEWLSVRYMLSQLDPEFKDIVYNKHGKPFLKQSKKHLSISHSYEMISVGIHAQNTIGIDLQRISDKVQRIKNKFLNVEELELLQDHSPLNLTLAWSVKEALFKVYGIDDIYLKENIRIHEISLKGKKGEAKGSIKTVNYDSEHELRLELIDNYVLAYLVNS